MATLGELRAELRNVLIDQTEWRDSQLTSWIQAAISDYSLNFPRLVRATIACVADTKAYSLSSYTILTVREVEYPSGETPRSILSPLPRTSESFDGGAYYDIASDKSYLYIGESPSAGESIILDYDTVHEIPDLDTTELTVPQQHLELLRLYVIWKATTMLEMDENVSIQRKREMMNALGLNAYRAERAYRLRMRDALAASTGSGVAGVWRMDSKDRIY